MRFIADTLSIKIIYFITPIIFYLIKIVYIRISIKIFIITFVTYTIKYFRTKFYQFPLFFA